MNLEGRTVWQQASGDGHCDYAELCIRWGLILNGYEVSHEPPPRRAPFETGLSSVLSRSCHESIRALLCKHSKKRDLLRFCHDMKDGDVVVLRRGTKEVLAAGVIVGDCFENDNFGDVDGWYLPLGRRVSWFWVGDEPKQFRTWGLKQGATTQRVKPTELAWSWLESLPEPVVDPEKAFVPFSLPHQTHTSIGKISDYLFDQGVASAAIRSLVDQIGELERIARWYSTMNDAPSEHETVAYLVVPMLRALGWTPQKMAVEWDRIDVALFSRLPREDGTLRVVVEVKKLHESCLSAEAQATGYAHARVSCDRFILTDGLRYGVFVRQGAAPFRLAAYLNLVRMRESYPIWDCAGAQEAFRLMAP